MDWRRAGKLEVGDWKLETGNSKLETGDWKFETGSVKLGLRYQGSGVRLQDMPETHGQQLAS
jgi:hypothetical protein